jgi:hypothetical protein
MNLGRYKFAPVVNSLERRVTGGIIAFLGLSTAIELWNSYERCPSIWFGGTRETLDDAIGCRLLRSESKYVDFFILFLWIPPIIILVILFLGLGYMILEFLKKTLSKFR